MKRLLLSLLLCLSIFSLISAQNFNGEYFVAATGGEIVLKLQTAGQGQLGGTLTDANGAQYQVQGTYEADDASGIISNQQGGLYFEAYLDGQDLILTLIPPSANQQPDYTKAQEFTLAKRGGSSPGLTPPATGNSGTISGPLGGNTGTTSNNNWSGSFSGNLNGTPTTLSLQQNGNQISGVIDAGGYKYNLSGTASGSNSQGQVTDPQTQGVMNYQGTSDGTNVNLTLNANGSQLQMQFSKGGASTQGGSLNNQGGNTGTNSNAQLDMRLVGNWLYTESYTSDGFSFASQWRMIVNQDGTYLYGDAKVAGGGGGVTGSSGGGGMTQGKWKTENGIIYIDEGYGWQPYAKYYVEGNSMMLTLSDGKRQVWKR